MDHNINAGFLMTHGIRKSNQSVGNNKFDVIELEAGKVYF
jgi:hypothetical protein